MKKNKIIREPINMKEFKKAEIEEKKEEIKELKKELAAFTEVELPARAKEDLTQTKNIKIEKIIKLKCDYKLFKNERQNNEMFVPNNCELCNKPFEENDKIYLAIDKQNKNIFICAECAEGEHKQN